MKRILIVDDHALVRDGIKRIFGQRSETIFIGEAATPPEALQLVQESDWDAAVLDLSLGGRSGLELLREMKKVRPALPIVILSMHSEEQYARRAFKAGAAGYVTKGSPSEEVLKAVDRVTEGGRYVSPSLAEAMVIELARGEDGPPHRALSDREFEVMCLIASGNTVGEIAARLSLSVKTISTYRARILEKMNMKTNAELTHYAIRNQLTE